MTVTDMDHDEPVREMTLSTYTVEGESIGQAEITIK
jgi:hypothetical protein